VNDGSSGYDAAVTFRCTQKVRDRLKLNDRALAPVPAEVEATDWYCHLLVLQRRPVYMVTHALSLFTVLFPAAGAAVPAAFAAAARREIRAGLIRTGYPQESETRVLDEAADRFCKATDRRVLGSMNDFSNLSLFTTHDAQSVQPWVLDDAVDRQINPSPMSFLGMESPRDVMRLLLQPRGNA
jgi:hypothetical protein